MKSKITIGSKVQYSTNWLQSISCFTGDLPFAKGTVTELKKLGELTTLATVEWDYPFHRRDDDDIPARVNVANLQPVIH